MGSGAWRENMINTWPKFENMREKLRVCVCVCVKYAHGNKRQIISDFTTKRNGLGRVH
jgi:hypothetical protein